jgi:hypothetical protein
MHETIEALSAYLDGEVSPAERSRIQGHLDSCSDCAARTRLLEGASATLQGLPPISPTADESRAIRQGVLGRARRRRAWLQPRWVGAGAGALALVLAGIYAGSGLFRGDEGGDVTAARERTQSVSPDAGPAPVFASPEELRAYITNDPVVRDAVRNSLTQTPPAAPAPALVPAPDDSTAEQFGDTGRSELRTGVAKTAPEAGAVPQERLAQDCLTDLLRGQGADVRSVLTRPATWEGKPAWLLVLAQSPPEPGGKDRLLVYLLGRGDCSLLAYQFIPAP